MQAPAHAQQQPEEALLRLQYAMALLRLVNGISDSGQKGRLALSVAQLANDAGVGWLARDLHAPLLLGSSFPHCKAAAHGCTLPAVPACTEARPQRSLLSNCLHAW